MFALTPAPTSTPPTADDLLSTPSPTPSPTTDTFNVFDGGDFSSYPERRKVSACDPRLSGCGRDFVGGSPHQSVWQTAVGACHAGRATVGNDRCIYGVVVTVVLLPLSVTGRGVLAVFFGTHGDESQAPTAITSRGFRALLSNYFRPFLCCFMNRLVLFSRSVVVSPWTSTVAIKRSKSQLYNDNTCIALANNERYSARA